MKSRAWINLPILFLISSFSSAQYYTPAGCRSVAMGSVSVAMSDCWSAHNNQAGMALYKRESAGLYVENQFLVKEMGYQAGAFTLPSRYGVFGVNLAYSGDNVFHTLNTGLAYAQSFGSHFSAGIQLDFLQTHLEGAYGNRGLATCEAGILARITEELSFGAHVFNPVRVKLADYNDERVPVVMNAGLCYSFSDKLLVAAEVYKNSAFPMEFRSGVEYMFFQKGFVRLGMATNPFRYTFGFGLETGKLTIDLSSTVHETLGYSPQGSLYYTFGR